MPSDSKKREQARKKEAQKKRNQKITVITKEDLEDAKTNGENGVTTNGTTNGVTTNGTTNGGPVELTEEGEYFEL